MPISSERRGHFTTLRPFSATAEDFLSIGTKIQIIQLKLTKICPIEVSVFVNIFSLA